ncbi:MAG: dTDP-4-dehydrorhamnose 3,5-epimerase family protein, partial [Rhodoferax sp.]|nr:dTDP-4-dehydrorhamnose 3,5-epimerase family protein [Rhodoferax sp.]
GWVMHRVQSDRAFVCRGTIKFVLYDTRPESPTHGVINEICISEENRGLILIPPLVVHALQNVGTEDAMFVNLPTKAYDYGNPDKYRHTARIG